LRLETASITRITYGSYRHTNSQLVQLELLFDVSTQLAARARQVDYVTSWATVSAENAVLCTLLFFLHFLLRFYYNFLHIGQ